MSECASKSAQEGRASTMLWGLLLAAIAGAPLLVNRPYFIGIGVFIGLYAIASIGLILLMGYAGQISLGQAAFYGIGAYTSAILSTKFETSPWLAMAAGAVLSGAIAAIIGAPVLKLKGFVLAGGTFAVGVIFYSLFVELHDLTGGTSGLGGIPRPGIGNFRLSSDLHYYYLVWSITLLLLIYSLNLIKSRVGRALRSLHLFAGGSEAGAASLGVDVARLKVRVFILSAVFTSLAGSLYAHYVTHVNPVPFGIWFSILLLVTATVGGLTSIWGGLLGSAIVVILRELLRHLAPRLYAGPTGAYESITFGLVLVLVLLFMPGGSYPPVKKVVGYIRARLQSIFVRAERPGTADKPWM